jgi:hypothetical protein
MRRLLVMSTVLLSLALAAVPFAVAQAASPSLTSLLVRPGEMPGFTTENAESATGPTQFVRKIYQETGKKASTDTAALKSAGFVAGAYEPLTCADNAQAVSSVLVFKSSADAKKYVSTEYAQSLKGQVKGATVTTLALGIPGAKAFTAASGGSQAGAASNAYFSKAHCLFVVGDFVAGTTTPSGPPVAAASKSVYKRAPSSCN